MRSPLVCVNPREASPAQSPREPSSLFAFMMFAWSRLVCHSPEKADRRTGFGREAQRRALERCSAVRDKPRNDSIIRLSSYFSRFLCLRSRRDIGCTREPLLESSRDGRCWSGVECFHSGPIRETLFCSAFCSDQSFPDGRAVLTSLPFLGFPVSHYFACGTAKNRYPLAPRAKILLVGLLVL